MSERSTIRDEQGLGAVYSPAEAVRRIPFRDADVRAWLEREGLIHENELGRYVVWREVLDRLQYGGPAPVPAKPLGATLKSANLEPRQRQR